MFLLKKSKREYTCCITKETYLVSLLLREFLIIYEIVQLIESFKSVPSPRSLSVAIGSTLNGDLHVSPAENARRMCVNVRNICFCQSDTRVNANAHCSQLRHGLHYCMLSIRDFNSELSRASSSFFAKQTRHRLENGFSNVVMLRNTKKGEGDTYIRCIRDIAYRQDNNSNLVEYE